MKATSNQKNEQGFTKAKKMKLKEQGNIRIEALHNIILTNKGRPDYLAIDIYLEARSWYKSKKTNIQGNIVYLSKLKGNGWQIGYEYLANKYKCSTELIRRKLVLLEKLGLLTRDFRTEYYHGKRFNNNMYLLVWKDTPHFCSDIGLEKDEQNSSKNTHTPIQQNKDSLSKNWSPPVQQKVDNIYVIPNNVEEDRAINSSKSSSLLNIEYDCRVVARDNAFQQETLPPITPHEERTSNAECRSLSVPNGAAPCLSEHSTELTLTHEQENEHYGRHNSRTSSNNQPISLLQVLANMQDIPIAANQNEENTSLAQCQQEVEILSTAIVKQDTKASEEVIVNTDKPTQLRQEIFKSFNPKTYEEIMENCTFTELEPNKLGISIQDEFSLNLEDKEKLKTCIRAVYGDEVKMVSTSSQNKQEAPAAQTQEAPIRQVKTEWDAMKEKIAKYFPENQYNHVKNTWLEHLSYSYASQEQIVVIGRGFYVDYITDKFASAIEFAVKQTKKSLIFQYEGNAQRPIEFKFKR